MSKHWEVISVTLIKKEVCTSYGHVVCK